MKRKDIKNKNLMSALTIGISAMMALSTPFTAYASNNIDGDGAPDDTPDEPQTTQSSTQEAVQAPETVTDAAQEQAVAAQDAATESAESALNEATEAAQNILEGNAEAGIEAISENEETAGTVADAAIDELAEAAKDIVQDDKDEEGNITYESAATHLQDATKVIEEAKTDLGEAEIASQEADKAASRMAEEGERSFEYAKSIKETTNAISKDTSEAQERAATLIDAINNATTEEEAQKAYEALEKDIEDTQSTIADKKAYYDRLMENYEKAKSELEKAEKALAVYEKAYSQNLDEALEKAQAAEEEIADAQTKVDNLAKALDKVEDELVDEVKEASKAAKAFDNLKSDWTVQRELMKSTVENYIIPQLEGQNISNVQWERVVGFDTQDYNYCKITYEVDGQTVKRYFNYDRINRSTGNDRYANLGNAWGIAIYEKSQDEIDADNFLREKYPEVAKIKHDDLKKRTNSGEFDVFSYINKDGEKVLLTRAMLNEAIDAEKISVAKDGTMKIKLGENEYADVGQIIQNKNSVIHEGNAYLIANKDDVTGKHKNAILKALKLNHSDKEAQEIYDSMVAANGEYHNYIGTARIVDDGSGGIEHVLSGKYERYEAAVEKAQEAVEEARDEAAKLSDAINDLKEVKKSRYVLAKAALKVDDIATYLGIEADAEKAAQLNKMTVQEALTLLNSYLQDANKTLSDAQENLGKLEQDKEKAQADLEAVKQALGGDQTADEGSAGEQEGPSTEPDPEPNPGPEEEESGGLITPDGPEVEELNTPETPTIPSGGEVVSDSSGRRGTTASNSQSDTPSGSASAAGAQADNSSAPAENGTSGAPASQGVSVSAAGQNVSAPAAGGGTVMTAETGAASDTGTATGTGTGVNTGTGAGTGQQEVTEQQTQIFDEAVSLAAAPELEEEEGQTQVMTDIEDEETATADMPVTKEKMNWWWALIILLLGEAGREMYNKYKKKEENEKK